MKKLFSFLFFFAAINIALAQSKPTQKQFVTLGGIESGSKVSIMQVLDYPVLVLADKNETIKSYDVTILSDGNVTNTTSYKVEGAKFNQNVLNELNAAKGKKGKIFIENIIVGKENINLKEQNMVFKFEE
ncbi:MAG: hypothetical protein IT256_02135 [Chitinophagaceae bacterium]|nr:hypothetical protein [Chitinophagaceae bacterium]